MSEPEDRAELMKVAIAHGVRPKLALAAILSTELVGKMIENGTMKLDTPRAASDLTKAILVVVRDNLKDEISPT